MVWICRYQDGIPYQKKCQVTTCPAHSVKCKSGCVFNDSGKEYVTIPDVAIATGVKIKKLQNRLSQFVENANIGLIIDNAVAKYETRCKDCKKPGNNCTDQIKCAKRMEAANEMLKTKAFRRIAKSLDRESVWAAFELVDKGVINAPEQWKAIREKMK